MKPGKIFKQWSRYSGSFMRSFCETLCFVGVFVVVLSLFGCESSFEDSSLVDDAEVEPVVIRNYQLNELLNAIPLASADEFNDFSDPYSYRYNGYLSCKVARDIGFAELMANLSLYYPPEIVSDLNINPDFFNWEENLSFSDVPVIVYGYDDLPYYYEFPLIFREETIVGTVTISARPYNDEIVAYVFPKPLQYINTTYKRYIGEYPNVYYEVGGNICYAKRVGDEVEFYPAEGELITNLSDALLSQIANIQDMDTLLLDLDEDAGYDEGEGYHSLEQYVSAFIPSEETASYWTDKSEEFAASPDEFFITPEIVDETITIAYQDNNTPSDPNTGFLEEYRNDNLRRTQWGDACGPSILSWLYRGKYDSYNGKYLPIHGDAVFAGFVGSDYPDFVEHISGNYAEYDMENKESLGEANDMATRERKSLATDGGLYYEFFQECLPAGRYWAMYDDDMRRSVPRVTNGDYKIKFITAPVSWIKNQQQPVVVEGVRGKTHYVGAIGYTYKVRRSGAKYNWRIFVMDNGNFVRHHDNYPYWEILGGLNYAWERQ